MNEIRELTEMEVEAVSGGGLFDITVGLNIAPQIGVAVAGLSVFGPGGNATVANLFGGQTTGVHA